MQLRWPAGSSYQPGSRVLPVHLCKAGGRGRGRVLRCCTLGVAEEGNRRLLGTIVHNGKGRDSSTSQTLIPVMSYAVMSVPCWVALSHLRVFSAACGCPVSGCIQRKGLKSCTAHFRILGIKFKSLSTHSVAHHPIDIYAFVGVESTNDHAPTSTFCSSKLSIPTREGVESPQRGCLQVLPACCSQWGIAK